MFVNLTPHTINIFDEEKKEVLAIPPSGPIARIRTATDMVDAIDGVPLFKTEVLGRPHLVDKDANEIGAFPNFDPATIYIVSGMFRAYFDRLDLYQPGKLIRNEKGQPIGCIGLSR